MVAMTQEMNTTTLIDDLALYETARWVFYGESMVAALFSIILVISLRSAASARAFHGGPHGEVKAAFRLAMLGVAISDLMQSASVIAYMFDLAPGDVKRTRESTLGCTFGAVISSTGEIASTLFTALLAVEGYLIIAKGVRTGAQRRAFWYVCSVVLTVLLVQILVGSIVGFGSTPDDNKSGTYVWCHTQKRTPAIEFLSFYLWLGLGFIISLCCYLRMEYKLRSMLKIDGLNPGTRNTIQRSRCKFFAFPIIFMLAWLPTAIHRIVWAFQSDFAEDSSGRWALLYLASMSAGCLPIMNAIAYGYFNQEVRPDLERFCQRLWCCRSFCGDHPGGCGGGADLIGTDGSTDREDQDDLSRASYVDGTGFADYSTDDQRSWNNASFSMVEEEDQSSREQGLLSNQSIFLPDGGRGL